MVAVVVFGFSGMRCQPLRRALEPRKEIWLQS
ncbi:acetyltransferase [Vibrio cholerae]|nr:acetyltransferase [Vibrio cholerae]